MVLGIGSLGIKISANVRLSPLSIAVGVIEILIILPAFALDWAGFLLLLLDALLAAIF